MTLSSASQVTWLQRLTFDLRVKADYAPIKARTNHLSTLCDTEVLLCTVDATSTASTLRRSLHSDYHAARMLTRVVACCRSRARHTGRLSKLTRINFLVPGAVQEGATRLQDRTAISRHSQLLFAEICNEDGVWTIRKLRSRATLVYQLCYGASHSLTSEF